MLNKIEEILGYKFSNIQLLDLALTHKSFDKAKNNERLEFLGDAVLNLIISIYKNLELNLKSDEIIS